MKIEAPSKINLALDVTGRRPDGYHLVRMVMQSLRLCDTVTVEKNTAPGIHLSSDRRDLPTDDGNLAWRAAALLMDEFGIDSGIDIYIEKRIPVAAGMAGGSTDAAAVLRSVNRIFSLGLSAEDLRERGLTLGADVPFCLMGGTVLAEGIGEMLTPLPPLPDCRILIGKPKAGISTGFVYRHLDEEGVRRHPDIDGMVRAVREGSLPGVISKMSNVLEQVTETACPEVRKIKKRMLEDGAKGVLMTGSGPTVFGIYTDEKTARRALEKLTESDLAEQTALTGPGGMRGEDE